LVVRRVLSLVDDDEWVAIRGDVAKSLASSEQSVSFCGEEVKNDKPFVLKKTLALKVPSRVIFGPPGSQDVFVRRKKKAKPLGGT
jgi:hypothetical protein